MSLPTDSVAPAPPTGTSNPWSLVQWWKRICDWIAALSPSGASVYEETTSGSLAGSYAGSWTATRYGKVVVLTWACSTSFAAGATALPLLDLPAGWRPANDVGASVAGVALYPWTGAVRTSGQVQVRNNHSAAQNTMFGTAVYRLP